MEMKSWLNPERDSARAPTSAPVGFRASRHPREAAVWKSAGIDVISMASNHSMDGGGAALMETLQLFRGMGRHCVGAGKNIVEARQPALVERNGVTIAVIAPQ
jgi:poly-gamma-glutamate capsule biosynthesis protein CapA/YwtB (metallophosphatase superfamily)